MNYLGMDHLGTQSLGMQLTGMQLLDMRPLDMQPLGEQFFMLSSCLVGSHLICSYSWHVAVLGTQL